MICIVIHDIVSSFNIATIVRYVARRLLSPVHRCRSPDVFLSAWMGAVGGTMRVSGLFVGHHLDAGAGKFDVVVVEARLKSRPANVDG